MKKNIRFFNDFSLCIPDEVIIEFIEINNNLGWECNFIVDKLGEYKHSEDLEYPDVFPLVDYVEEDENTIQYWLEAFLETYSEEIGDRSVYLIKTPN